MQDETSQATMALFLRTGEFTARSLRDAIARILREKDVLSGKIRDASAERTTLRTLVEEGSEITNLRLDEEEMAEFRAVARKYDLRYSVKRDRSAETPGYRVFFRARDWDTLWKALEEYACRDQRRRDRSEEPVSVRRLLREEREQARLLNQKERTRIPKYREELR